MPETDTQRLFREADKAASWANPLTRKERAALARYLASWCHRFYNMPGNSPRAMYSQIIASAEMSDLHMDVTERAALPRREEAAR